MKLNKKIKKKIWTRKLNYQNKIIALRYDDVMRTPIAFEKIKQTEKRGSFIEPSR